MTGRARTYADAPDGLIALWQKRRGALGFAPGEALAPPDCDLAALTRLDLPAEPPPVPEGASRHIAKEHELRRDLAGKSELALLHGLVIAHLRKRRYPAHAPALFHRIWAEQTPHLLETLTTRWLISAVITFGDHGQTEAQRSLGREMGMMFSLMKLYEFERLHSGQPPDQPFGLRGRSVAALPLDMPAFSLAAGGLDINLLAPVWQRAQGVEVLGPLACHLLDRVNADPGTLFRRLTLMREERQAKLAAKRAKG